MRFRSLLAVAFLVLFAAFVPACSTDEEYQAALETAVSGATELQQAADNSDAQAKQFDEKIVALEATITSLSASLESIQDEAIKAKVSGEVASRIAEIRLVIDATQKQSDGLKDAATNARAEAEKIMQRVAAADKAVQDTASASERAGQLATDATVAIPAVGAFAGLIGYLVKLVRSGAGMKSAIETLTGKVAAGHNVVRSIDTVTKVSPELLAAWEKIKPALAKLQDPKAMTFVDEAQGKTKDVPTT